MNPNVILRPRLNTLNHIPKVEPMDELSEEEKYRRKAELLKKALADAGKADAEQEENTKDKGVEQ